MTFKVGPDSISYIECDTQDCEKAQIKDVRYDSGLSSHNNKPMNESWQAVKENEIWLHYCPKHRRLGIPDRVILPHKSQGLQSDIETVFSRADPEAMLALGRVLAFGEKKYQYKDVPLGEENWRYITVRDHIDHALEHLFKELREMQHNGEAQPDDEDAGTHLEHALCRVMFALGVKLNKGVIK